MFKKKPMAKCHLCKKGYCNECCSPNCMCIGCADTVEKQKAKLERIMDKGARYKPPYNPAISKYSHRGRAYNTENTDNYINSDNFSYEDDIRKRGESHETSED